MEFVKKNGMYEAEFEATADFNLHVERKKGGRFVVYQKTVGNGEYDIVDGLGTQSHKDVIDIDMSALVYPKYIKVVSESEVTYAEVVTDGEVSIGGGASGGSSDWHYFKLPEGFPKENYMEIASAAYLIKGQSASENIINTAVTVVADYIQNESFTLSMIAMDYSVKFLYDNRLMTVAEFFAQPNDIVGDTPVVEMWFSIGITEATEEEFYSLN